ncbi:hypothetical protein E2C01_082416 [Portunus trituberculatus]|uniref:Uncharacterized protein n=1 Tax=Portunus trituberculatus TaxID=210409 RepID=A0A5B7IPW0_PORTR|nr:hypothetical protein [Portunus trituberculatus]
MSTKLITNTHYTLKQSPCTLTSTTRTDTIITTATTTTTTTTNNNNNNNNRYTHHHRHTRSAGRPPREIIAPEGKIRGCGAVRRHTARAARYHYYIWSGTLAGVRSVLSFSNTPGASHASTTRPQQPFPPALHLLLHLHDTFSLSSLPLHNIALPHTAATLHTSLPHPPVPLTTPPLLSVFPPRPFSKYFSQHFLAYTPWE